MDFGLKGKRAIVTGGSGGIGRASALELAREGAKVCVTARDERALESVVKDLNKAGGEGMFVCADLTSLPFPDGVFDAATVAFGMRNLADMPAGLREIHRVLVPGGTLAILEFSHPEGWLRKPYRFYLNTLLPQLGNLLSRRGEAYRYLAESIMGFPDPDTLVDLMRDAGFEGPSYQRLTGGIVAIHRATT